MKRLTFVLIVVLLLVGVALVALPAAAAPVGPADSAGPALWGGHATPAPPPIHPFCFPPPCDCGSGGC